MHKESLNLLLHNLRCKLMWHVNYKLNYSGMFLMCMRLKLLHMVRYRVQNSKCFNYKHDD